MDKQRKLILAEIELKTYEHKQQETQRFEQIIDKQKTPNTTLPEKKGEVPNYLKRFELSVPLMLPDNKPVDDTYFIPDYPYYNIDGITDFEQEVY